jgi:hypothetical protein
MGEACGTHGGRKKCIEGFVWKLKEKCLLEEIGVDEKIVKWHLKTHGRKWVRTVCLRTEASGGLI